MKTAVLAGLVSFAVIASAAPTPEPFDEVMKRASLDYVERLKKAADELNRTRTRLMQEKAPFLQELRAAEDRIITAEGASVRLNTSHEAAAGERRTLLKDIDAFRRNSTYIA